MRSAVKQWETRAGAMLDYGLYVLLGALILLFGVISHSFLTISNWTQISIAACFLLTASAGLTLVMITGCIDVSIGSIAYLAAASVYLTAGYPFFVPILAAISIGLGAGLFGGFLVSYLGMNSLLTTLGLMIAYRGISLLLTGGTMHPVGPVISGLGKIEFFGVLPVVFLVSLAVMVVLQIVLESDQVRRLLLRHRQQRRRSGKARSSGEGGEARRLLHFRRLWGDQRPSLFDVPGGDHHLYRKGNGVSGCGRRRDRRNQSVWGQGKCHSRDLRWRPAFDHH